MAPIGTIYAQTNHGNFRVRPRRGGRDVVLSRSEGLSFDNGVLVWYGVTRQGRYVAFSKRYQRHLAGRPSIDVVLRIPKREVLLQLEDGIMPLLYYQGA